MAKNYRLELIVGPMFAGKTEELIRKLRRYTYAKKNIILFKPNMDNRYSTTHVVSHNQDKLPAICINNIEDIEKYIKNEQYDIIAIDEVQFINGDVVNYLQNLANTGYHVICSGLNTDFRDQPFKFMPNLMSIADKIHFATAICMICGEDATKSQRLINNKPAKYDDPIISLGEKDSYEARCRKHHVCLVEDKNEK